MVLALALLPFVAAMVFVLDHLERRLLTEGPVRQRRSAGPSHRAGTGAVQRPAATASPQVVVVTLPADAVTSPGHAPAR